MLRIWYLCISLRFISGTTKMPSVNVPSFIYCKSLVPVFNVKDYDIVWNYSETEDKYALPYVILTGETFFGKVKIRFLDILLIDGKLIYKMTSRLFSYCKWVSSPPMHAYTDAEVFNILKLLKSKKIPVGIDAQSNN